MKEKIPQAKYGNEKKPLKIGEVEIPCYVLDNGMRVLTQRGLTKALGMSTGGGTGGAQRIVQFIDSKSVTPFINNDLKARIENPIKFTINGILAYGYEATILQQVVKGVTKAFLQNKLHQQQSHIGRSAEVLDDAFSKVGLIALIDEATGYQYDRETDELQKILKAYIAEELLPWQKRFPDEFYREIFRLNNWDYTVSGIQQRPSVIGTWTKKLIYQQLPKGVLQELYDKTPKTSTGKLAKRLHQSLTADIGNPHLEKQLVSVITLMNISKDWNEFKKFFNKKFGQQELQLDSVDQPITVPQNPQLSEYNKKLKTALNYNPKEDKK